MRKVWILVSLFIFYFTANAMPLDGLSLSDLLNDLDIHESKCNQHCTAPSTEMFIKTKPFKCSHSYFHPSCLQAAFTKDALCPVCSAAFNETSNYAKQKLLAATLAIKKQNVDWLKRILSLVPKKYETFEMLRDVVPEPSAEIQAVLFEYLLACKDRKAEANEMVAKFLQTLTIAEGNEGALEQILTDFKLSQQELLTLIKSSIDQERIRNVAIFIRHMRGKYDMKPVWDLLFQKLTLKNLKHHSQTSILPSYALWVSIIKANDSTSLPVLSLLQQSIKRNDIYTKMESTLRTHSWIKSQDMYLTSMVLTLFEYSSPEIFQTLIGSDLYSSPTVLIALKHYPDFETSNLAKMLAFRYGIEETNEFIQSVKQTQMNVYHPGFIDQTKQLVNQL